MDELIKENVNKRLAFMRALYEMSEGSTIDLLDSHEIGKRIGINNLAEISKIVSHLEQEGLIDGDFAAGVDANAYIALTAYGISLVEQKANESSGPVTATNIQNTINIHGDNHGNLQSGNINTITSPNKETQSRGVLGWVIEHIGIVITSVLIAAILSWLGIKS